MSRKSIILFVGLAAVMLILFACEDDVTDPNGAAPDIPPISTFKLDFDAFPEGDTTGLVTSYANWGFSAWNVGFWNTVVTVNAIVPVAAYVASFSHTPYYDEEEEAWIWEYDFTVFSVSHHAELHGSTDIEGVYWDMYLSRDGEYTDFNWYSGFSNLPATEGTWTLNSTPTDPTPYIGIEWNRNPVDNTADIKYTNIIPDHAENGGYIFYGTTTDSVYNAFYDIYNKGADNHTYIEWHLTDKNGHVRDLNQYEDTLWHCWDTTLADIDCE